MQFSRIAIARIMRNIQSIDRALCISDGAREEVGFPRTGGKRVLAVGIKYQRSNVPNGATYIEGLPLFVRAILIMPGFKNSRGTCRPDSVLGRKLAERWLQSQLVWRRAVTRVRRRSISTARRDHKCTGLHKRTGSEVPLVGQSRCRTRK